jgi:signal transduction histidine kinase
MPRPDRSGARARNVRASTRGPGGSIRGALLQLTLILVGAALVVVVALTLITTSMHRASDRLWNAKTSVRAAHQVEIGLLLHERASLLAALTGAQRYQQARSDALDRLQTALEIEDRIPHETEVALQLALQAYLLRRTEIELDDDTPLARYVTMSPEVESAIEASETFIAGARDRAHAARGQADRWNRVADGVAVAIAALLLVAVFVVVLRLRRTYRAFEAVRAAIGRYSHGNSDARAPEKGPAELLEIAHRFNRMADRLSRQRETQLHFLSAVAHDLRTPLAALDMTTAMGLRRTQDAPDEIRRAFELVARQVRRLESMSSDLLEVSRAEAGRVPLRMRHCDLGSLADESAQLLSCTAPSHDLAVIHPKAPVLVRCDPDRVSQVLNNLISNAIKYSPDGGRVALAIAQRADEAVITVSDEGVGMTGDQLEEIFDPFSRLPATADVPGVGMGLWITKRLIEAHGGSIEVTSTPGQGSRFSVHLPLAGA